MCERAYSLVPLYRLVHLQNKNFILNTVAKLLNHVNKEYSAAWLNSAPCICIVVTNRKEGGIVACYLAAAVCLSKEQKSDWITNKRDFLNSLKLRACVVENRLKYHEDGALNCDLGEEQWRKDLSLSLQSPDT